MCADQACMAGMIAGELVALADWPEKIAAFAATVKDFDERGRTSQIPHPGFATVFRCCSQCGRSLAGENVQHS